MPPNIYALNLHESLIIIEAAPVYTRVTRVPGGWIYTTYFNKALTSCFVPYYPPA